MTEPRTNPEDDSIDLVDRLVAEYADRLARDEDPRREELLARAPEHRTELERCFRMLEDAPAEAGPGTLTAGRELGDYRLGRVLGRGGMAVVHEAEQASLGRRVALKILRPHLTLDEKQLERFQREARAAAKLRHPNVVPIHAVGNADGHAFIAFELVPGPSLAVVVDTLAGLGRRPGAADLARVTGRDELAGAPSYAAACVQLFADVLAGVEHAHARGVIHRDLKPSNVLLDAGGRALVADFGLAKDLGEASLSITGETIGTPHYMSPEQAEALGHRVDARTDVYSLGATLYELLTLRRPFEGRTLQELVRSIVAVPPRPPSELVPDVPERLGDVVLKAMAKAPAERYADVTEFRADLEAALRGEEVRAPRARGLTALFGGWFVARVRGQPFEYRTRATILGLPWIHVVHGMRDPVSGQPRWARGVIACGDFALGVYAAGQVAVGGLALGMIALGPIALGAMVLGLNAFGGLAFGWSVTGALVAGVEGRGLVSTWVLRQVDTPALATTAEQARTAGPSPALLTTVVGIALSLTMIQGMWSRLWPDESRLRIVRRVTRVWMPLAFLLPLALRAAGLELPLMANLVLAVAISGSFSLVVRRRLGAPGTG